MTRIAESGRLAVFLALCVFIVACPLTVRGDGGPRAPEVRLSVTVDWEGEVPDEESLAAMRAFRKAHPNLKLVHFLNAAYFTKAGIDKEEAARKIRSAIEPGDELGLHVHAWRSLVEAAGVKYRPGPTYEGAAIAPVVKFAGGVVDEGHAVPLSDYSTEEIRMILRKSKSVLKEMGFPSLTSFRCGGWVAYPHVLEALAAEGISIDSSFLPSDLEQSKYVKIAPILRKKTEEAAPGVRVITQPFTIETPKGAIREFPNNAGMADYVDSKGTLRMFKANFREMLRTQATGMHFNMGFHQENAARFLPAINTALAEIDTFMEKYPQIKVRPITLAESVGDPLPPGPTIDCRSAFQKIVDFLRPQKQNPQGVP